MATGNGVTENRYKGCFLLPFANVIKEKDTITTLT